MENTLEKLLAAREEAAAKLADLDRQIEAERTAARREAIAKAKEFLSTHGLTIADLAGETKAPKATGAKGPPKGQKVAAKYKDPATGQSWSGRGLKPKWLAKALEEGKKIEDFAI